MRTRVWRLARDIELRPVLMSCLNTDHVDRLLLASRHKPESIDTQESDFAPEDLYIPPASEGFIR
jgi:hypothetical protein